jgi:hypothetical protein
MTTEPSSGAFIVTSAFIALLGPVLGPFALLLFGAVAGSMLAMGKAASMSRWDGFWFVMVGIVISLSLTGLAVWAVERWTAIPGNLVLVPIAFALSAGRDYILALIKRVFDALGTLFETLFARGADK